MTQRYDTYKDSGVQWLGEIPGHWGCVPIKRLIDIYNGSDYKEVECTEGVPVFGSGGPFTYAKEIMYDGEVVMYGRKGTIDKPLYYMGAFWTIDTMFYSVVKSDKLLAKFQYYVSTQMPLKKLSTSTALPSMTMTTLGSIRFPLPPLSEQHSIVSYLDDKCSKIDEWIEKKQKEVELLGEMKQRVIADAVTRGLNPNVKMKPSGIFWIPDIPESWTVKRLGRILKKENRERPYNAELLVCTNKAKVVKRGDSKMGLIADSEDVYQGVQKGDLLIHGMDTWHGAIAVSEFEGMCTPVVHVCTSDDDVNFIALYLRYMAMMKVFKLISNGVRQNTSDFRSWAKVSIIPCPLPPISEQHAIVSYINERTAKIDKLVENVNREIENLKEYKQRLISDVVTGQIKVC